MSLDAATMSAQSNNNNANHNTADKPAVRQRDISSSGQIFHGLVGNLGGQSSYWGDLEVGGSCEEIALPHSEPIPQQNWTLACSWISVVGRDIVACLFSRDWLVSTSRGAFSLFSTF